MPLPSQNTFPVPTARRLPTPRRRLTARRRRSQLLLGLLGVALLLVPLLPQGATAEPIATTTRRPGIRVRFATIDGQTGLTGNAFLLFSSRRVSLDTPPSACAGTRVVRAEARGSRGLVRKLELTLHIRRDGDLTVQTEGCPRAELRAELEDGTVLSGLPGERVCVRVEQHA